MASDPRPAARPAVRPIPVIVGVVLLVVVATTVAVFVARAWPHSNADGWRLLMDLMSAPPLRIEAA